jgi:hypothetical protein
MDGAACGTPRICRVAHDVANDTPSHCGGCDNACGTSEVCVDESSCTPLDGTCQENGECCANSF